ncbi:MAG: hypothetical protein ACKVOP_02490 [Sphingomonadaceae bacterium]
MNQDSFEAAVRLIMCGPADQPLVRVLRIAMDLADCPSGMIGVRRADRFDLIISSGLSLADFRHSLPRSEGLARRLQQPTIIEDAHDDVDFAVHPFVAGASAWRFIVNIPLPFSRLAFDVVMTLGDTRADQPRRHNLIERLEECAAIMTDQFALIGDVATQAEYIALVRESAAHRAAGVRDSALPMALVKADQSIAVINEAMRTALSATADLPPDTRLPDLFPVNRVEVAELLDTVLFDGPPAAAILVHTRAADRPLLANVLRVVSGEIDAPMALFALADGREKPSRSRPPGEPGGDSPAVLSEFLLATLVWQKRLLRRGDVPYHALARWRASVRDTQLEAVKALKRDPSGFLLDALSDRMTAAATALFGRDTFRAVVPVPCGNSGEHCLSKRLGARIAERLDVPCIDAFAPIPVRGTSHPRRNRDRPAMTVTNAPDVPVLLIDDVATSGAHIEEAARLLRRTAPAVLPLVWIAD